MLVNRTEEHATERTSPVVALKGASWALRRERSEGVRRACSPEEEPPRGLKLPSALTTWSHSAAVTGGCSAVCAASSLAAIVRACSDAPAGYACSGVPPHSVCAHAYHPQG